MSKALLRGFKTFIRNSRQYIGFLFLPFLCSCATAPSIQPQINQLVLAGRINKALAIIDNQPEAYGSHNKLLYLLDHGLLLHLSKNYKESISVFDQAKLEFDHLFTKSLTKMAGTWVINDYAAPYRGEDFERVALNIFQALNYANSGYIEDALVEARDVDSKLNAINSQYSIDYKSVYKEDAFARFLMGILYEIGGTKDDLNDAFISYIKAAEVYELNYTQNYGLNTPSILKENILTTVELMGPLEFQKYRRNNKDVQFFSLQEKKRKAEVYLIQYNGFSPIKVQDSVPIPLPDRHIIKLAFPRYISRVWQIKSSRLKAKSEFKEEFLAETELCQDISAIARRDLANRKARVIAKAVLRPAGKYFIEKELGKNIRKRYGEDSAEGFTFISNLYNLSSEQADLRSWQTLPAEIRIARLLLDQGTYEFTVENFNDEKKKIREVKLEAIRLNPGDKKFFMIRTAN